MRREKKGSTVLKEGWRENYYTKITKEIKRGF